MVRTSVICMVTSRHTRHLGRTRQNLVVDPLPYATPPMRSQMCLTPAGDGGSRCSGTFAGSCRSGGWPEGPTLGEMGRFATRVSRPRAGSSDGLEARHRVLSGRSPMEATAGAAGGRWPPKPSTSDPEPPISPIHELGRRRLMIIVDTHCHALAHWFEPVEMLLHQMNANGVDKATLVQV